MSKIMVPLAAAVVLGVAACGDGGPSGPAEGSMRVRLVNAMSAGQELRLVAKGAIAVEAVGAGQSSAWAVVPLSVTVLLVQRRIGGGSVTVPVVPQENGHFAVTAMGDANVLYATVAEADTGKAVPGRANLRVINLGVSSQAPIVDIYVTPPGADLSAYTRTWELVAYASIYTGLKDFAPGDLQVRVTLRGTTTVVGQSGTITVPADQIRVVTMRYVGPGGFELSVATDTGQ